MRDTGRLRLFQVIEQAVAPRPEATLDALEWLIRVVAEIEITTQTQRFEGIALLCLMHGGVPTLAQRCQPFWALNAGKIAIKVGSVSKLATP